MTSRHRRLDRLEQACRGQPERHRAGRPDLRAAGPGLSACGPAPRGKTLDPERRAVPYWPGGPASAGQRQGPPGGSPAGLRAVGGQAVTLRARLRKLEQRCGDGRPDSLVLFLDPLDGGPALTCIDGRWQAVEDVAAFREQYRGVPLSVVVGSDPLVLVGERLGIDVRREGPP